MKISKAEKRDRKINRRRHGMCRDGDSVKTIEKEWRKRRDTILKKRRKVKEEILNGQP